ncbi:MAG: DNA double-strand break repair nuclease NurA [Sulfolobales archaeon]
MIPGAIKKISGELSELRSILKEIPPMEVLEAIQNLWSRYSPSPSGECVSGVDSGYNYLEMRGYLIYLVDGAYVNSCGGSDGDVRVGILASEVDPESYLSYLSILIEVEMARRAMGSSDIVAIDGSLISKLGFLIRKAPYIVDDDSQDSVNMLVKALVELSIGDRHRFVFISKNSVSRDLIRTYFPQSYKALRTDFYYLSRYTIEPGYTRPLIIGGGEGNLGVLGIVEQVKRIAGLSSLYIAVSYVRLRAGGPIMRIEVPLKNPDNAEEMVRDIMRGIAGDDTGYPLVLRVADKLARVSSRDMDRIKRILGLGSEEQAWEVAKAL